MCPKHDLRVVRTMLVNLHYACYADYLYNEHEQRCDDHFNVPLKCTSVCRQQSYCAYIHVYLPKFEPVFTNSVNELLKIKEDLTKERDEQLQEIVKLREQLADASSRQHDLEITHTEANAKIQEVERRVRRLKVISFNQNPKLTSIKINLPPTHTFASTNI